MTFTRAAFLLALALLPLAAPADSADPRVALGRRLFEESWLRPPADDSPLAIAPGGDGLGPLFNGASCAECHRLGGVGGAGPNEHNVEVVSVVLPFGVDESRRIAALRRAAAIHPAFVERSHLVLHRSGIPPAGETESYESRRQEILNLFPLREAPAEKTQIETPNRVTLQFAQRNTTAMFGAGVIDRIAPQTLSAIAAMQQAQHPRQAGRVSLGGRGRFGWRGQVDSLESFVRTACAEECGLRVGTGARGVVDQAAYPLRKPARKRSRVEVPVDLSEGQVEALVAFSASLPAPVPVRPDDANVAIRADEGRALFGELGCAVCHVEHVAPARHIFSDLLLHDMGRPLADRVKAPAASTGVNRYSADVRVALPQNTYYGDDGIRTLARTFIDPPSLNDLETATREWKTPPLWGVADSAPYLHDGRAETLDEAIRLHAGEGTDSAERYAALPEADRGRLLAFLATLRAPQID